MDLDPSRLRRGEWVVTIGAVVLLASVFALPWYAVKAPYRSTASLLGVATSPDGWHSLTHVRWLLMLTIIAGLALGWLQATQRAPALPTAFSGIVTALSLVTVLVLAYRVLINVPGADSVVGQRVGAYVGLLSACAILYGGYASLREEGVAAKDGPGEIEVVNPRPLGGS